MSGNRNRNRNRNGGGHNGANHNGGGHPNGGKVDLWGPVPVLDDPAPIVPAPKPGAVLRSLGDPPLQGRSVVAGHYLDEVAKRAASLATALAAAAGLLAPPDPDEH